jgi:ATP-dependent Lon protease
MRFPWEGGDRPRPPAAAAAARIGLQAGQLEVTDAALRGLVRRYTREAGVRQLERVLASLCHKVAARVAADAGLQVRVEDADLRGLLGPERFFDEDLRARLQPGVAPGLAWTEAGGTVLYVESVLLLQSRELLLTGQLGDVMRESARAALSWLRAHAAELGLETKVLNQGVHVHVPAGATPKDGPSAGVAMATALASLYAGIPARGDVAMTGEITLTGLVLPVGGICEKLLAAHRAGMREVIIPARNGQELTEVPANVREALRIHTAAHVTDVFAVALPALAARVPVKAAAASARPDGDAGTGAAASGPG